MIMCIWGYSKRKGRHNRQQLNTVSTVCGSAQVRRKRQKSNIGIGRRLVDCFFGVNIAVKSITNCLDAVYSDTTLPIAIFKNRFNGFQSGPVSVFDAACPGLTVDSVTKMHDLVLTDCRLKIRKIAEVVRISRKMVVRNCTKYWV